MPDPYRQNAKPDEFASSAEIRAIEQCARAMDPMDLDQRVRIINYLMRLYTLEIANLEAI